MQPPPAPPLAIAPAPTGSKALVVCAEGREEETVAAAWAAASRRGGAAVSVCPPGFLGSHVGTSAGTYDSIVVEDGENVSGAALGEVRLQVIFWCGVVWYAACVCFFARVGLVWVG